MRWISRLRGYFREVRNLESLLAMPADERPLVVYSEDIASYIQFEGYLRALIGRYGRQVTYVTSAPDDPLLEHAPNGMVAYYVNRLLPSFMQRLDSPVCLVTMPDLGTLHVRRPAEKCCCVYVFHSLNSIHEVYRESAFDCYDVFFCTGPHHKAELEKHFRLCGLNVPILHEVGYYKLDRVAAAHAAYTRKDSQKKTVLVAPSWGKDNVLESAGAQVVRRLLALGVRVIIRPHPCFHLPIYPKGRHIVESLRREFGSHPDVILEDNINNEDSFHEADLMISDFSGAAFEYALGTLRPVLFVDVPRKTRNPRWEKLGLPTFEDTVRHEVGRVISREDMGRIDRSAAELIEDQDHHEGHLRELRPRLIYNFGRSAEVGAAIVNDILGARD